MYFDFAYSLSSEESLDTKEDINMASKVEKCSSGVDMDIDDDEVADLSSIYDLDEESLTTFCRKASMSFFNENGLISHQINSYNDFIKNGLQMVFDSLGETIIEPGYDPSKKKESYWQYASVRFGKVSLDKPSFFAGTEGGVEHNMLPRHARLQNMTYSSRIKVNVTVEVSKVIVISRKSLNLLVYICTFSNGV